MRRLAFLLCQIQSYSIDAVIYGGKVLFAVLLTFDSVLKSIHFSFQDGVEINDKSLYQSRAITIHSFN